MSAAFGLAALFYVVTLLLIIFLLRGTPRPAATAVPAPRREVVTVPDIHEG
jgi:hypothetical protein